MKGKFIAKEIYFNINFKHFSTVLKQIHQQTVSEILCNAQHKFNLFCISILKKKELPKFRHEALEAKFCEHMTTICNIFKDYGDLKDYFNIRQMLTILKTDDWANIPPL